MPTTSRDWQTSINTQGLMLDKKTIENLRKDLKFSDPTIFEKTVRVFSLLESLLEFYADLIFKGGTSILFYQFPPARLSIDIDILLYEKDWVGLLGNLEAIVESSGVFKSVEEDER